MGRYRIGNDMTVVWSIYDHTGAAYYLKGKEVRLYYTCERGRFEADFEIQGTNKVVWSFWGREQKVIGDYTLSLEIIESAGKRRIFKDYCNAFTLVGKSCEETALRNPNISEDGNIVLSSKLDVYKIQPIIPTVGSNSNWFVDDTDTGKPSTGKSAYEYAKEKGYEGTESEYAESLKLAPENSEKLAELSENLDKIDSDAIHIADAYGNIILTIDAEGIHTTDVEIQSGKMSEVISAIIEGLATKLGQEIDSDSFQIQDANGNIAFRIDSEGVHTPKSDSWIVSMILGETYIPTSTQRDESGDVQSAEIVYPDGNKGSILVSSRDENGVAAMIVGYKDRSISVTIQRDSLGNVTKINIE